jgi:hypothetical protein
VQSVEQPFSDGWHASELFSYYSVREYNEWIALHASTTQASADSTPQCRPTRSDSLVCRALLLASICASAMAGPLPAQVHHRQSRRTLRLLYLYTHWSSSCIAAGDGTSASLDCEELFTACDAEVRRSRSGGAPAEGELGKHGPDHGCTHAASLGALRSPCLRLDGGKGKECRALMDSQCTSASMRVAMHAAGPLTPLALHAHARLECTYTCSLRLLAHARL